MIQRECRAPPSRKRIDRAKDMKLVMDALTPDPQLTATPKLIPVPAFELLSLS